MTKYELDQLYNEMKQDQNAADKAQWFGLYDPFENGTVDIFVKIKEDNPFTEDLLKKFNFELRERKT